MICEEDKILAIENRQAALKMIIEWCDLLNSFFGKPQKLRRCFEKSNVMVDAVWVCRQTVSMVSMRRTTGWMCCVSDTTSV